MADWTEQLAWLPVGAPDNSYPFEILDCRAACAALTLSQIDVMGSEAVGAIEQAARSMPSVTEPTAGLSAPCSISVATTPDHTPLHVASPSEHGHRWLIEISGQTILARRRSTGQLVHVAEFETRDSSLMIRRLTSGKQFVYGSSQYAIAEMTFLTGTYLEGVRCPFPVPPGLNRNETTKIALGGWKAHGIAAEFARLL
jgi:hypothetical protein